MTAPTIRSLFCGLALIAPMARAQMVSGRDMPGFDAQLGLQPRVSQLDVQQIGTSLVTNVLHPGEQGTFEFLLTNRASVPRQLNGRLKVIGYRTSVPPGDIWTPHVYRTANGATVPVKVTVPANGRATLRVRPTIPARYGVYALVFDFGSEGRAFGSTVARAVAPSPGRVYEPTYAIDMPWPHEMSEAVTRTFNKLGVKGCRMGVSYTPTTHPNFEPSMRRIGEHLEWCRKNNITVMLTIGAGDAPMPLGRGRPWLREDGTLIEGVKEDLAWLPQYDVDFRKWVRLLCERYGWPRGPVNAVELWNEPWEGVSISGWGADLPRYREIYQQMGLGVLDARRAGSKVLIGGTSSSSNTRDKLFPDASSQFLQMLDFVSIHYEGTGASPGLDPLWMGRKGEYGRVRVWDTESWVANSEDRIAGVVASMRSFGQDRAMGTYGGNVYSPSNIQVGNTWRPVVQAWSPASAVAAAARFIGQRPFERLLFRNGLPWVYVFGGEKHRDDGTLVVLGDMTKLYSPRGVLFASAQLKLPAKGGTLRIVAEPAFRMLDFAGNPVAPVAGRYTIPLNSNGYFLRTDGTPGSFSRLQQAVRAGRIEGYPPVVLAAKDFTDPKGGSLRVQVTNVLNRTVQGRLTARIGGKTVAKTLRLAANESREEHLPSLALIRRPDNLYPTLLEFVSDSDGKARLDETLRVNVIERRTPKIDGDLEDWKDALPLTLNGQALRTSVTEEAWLPFKRRAEAAGQRLTVAHVSHDQQGFYFAARIADPTPYPGNVRFETRDDDRYYYPQVAQAVRAAGTGFAVRWTGRVTAPVDGAFRIITETDDGVRLWIDGKSVVDQWIDRGPTADEVPLRLKKGQELEIRMDYYQGGGGAVARLLWEGPNLDRQPIPGKFRREVFADREFQNSLGGRDDSKIDFTLGPELPGVSSAQEKIELRWPEGVRRFSYRMDPDLPAGIGTDNVQIAFNVLPNAKKYWRMNPNGVMPKYMVYPDTDYEYALNSVAEVWGGGTEIFRLLSPGMPRKHFYPRQPKAKIDGGPVKQGRLVIRRVGTNRIVEAFLPWSEIPDVRAARDAGKTIKFSFRVNDNDGPAYELAQGRSVSKENNAAFHNDWTTHWANELEFSFGR